MTYKTNNSKKKLRARAFRVISVFINLNMDFGRSKSRKFNKQNTSKLMFSRITVHVHTTYCNFNFFV